MKLISTAQLIESTVETIFIKKHPYELSTLTTSQEFSTTDVKDRMMKEAKDVEDSTVLPASGYSNGQIETLNGASPKSCHKILDVNKSPLSFDVTVKKVTIPPQWEKLNSSSSSESFTLSRSVASNGIPVDSIYDNESDILLSEEENERNSLGFDFIDDSEKFGLSDSEVDKLLKDVDEKDKSDVPESTKTSEEEENGIEDSNNETFTAAVGTTRAKSGNLADMLLSNFEKQLQTSFEVPISNNISNNPEQNHVSEKEIKTHDVPKVFNKSDSKIENNITDTTESIHSDSKQSVDNHNDDVLKSVAQSSLVTEKCVEISVDIDKLKQDCLETESGNESSHRKTTDHESKENENCILKADDSREEDLSNSKTTEQLGSNTKYNDLQHEDTCNKTTDLLEDNTLYDSQDKESFNKTSLLENSTLSDSQAKESFNETGVLENVSVDLQDKESINNKNADENHLADESNHLADENNHLADEITLDDNMPDTEMKNSELIEAEGDLESEVKNPEADELQDDLMETNEIPSDMELQDITQASEKSLDADDVDMDESHHNDNETSNYNNKKSAESVMHSEVTENSMDSEIHDEKDAELDSNTDFQNESVGSPANESNNAQDVDEQYEQISEAEISSNSITQLREKDSELPTPGTDEKEHAVKISDTIDSSDNENSLIVDTSDNENSLVQPEHSMDNNEAERLVRKRVSSLEDNDERVVKRTKAADDFDSSESVPECVKDSDSAIEKKTTEVVDNSNRVEKEDKDSSDKVVEIKNVEEVSESLKDSKMDDETNDENEKSKSDSVCDDKKIKENEKRCSVEKDVQSKESEVVRTGTKRVHEQIGLIEVKKVRITPEMESQLIKLSNSEKLQKSSTGSTAKVLLVDKNATQSTNNHQNDQHKQTDSESVSVGEAESKEKDDEVRDSSNDVTKSKESLLAGKEDSSEGMNKEKVVDDDDKSTGDKQVENIISDNSQNEKQEDGRTTPPPKLKNSLPPRSPKSNLDLAIERVVLGLTDDPEEITIADKPKEPKNLNPMPFIRNLQDNLLKNLSKNDLEEVLVQKMCEAVTDRCTIGDMRQRCQTLEQMLEQWRKKVQQLQKQLKDMEMVMKRYIGDARTRKERPIPVKITRSVGLQVHMGPMNPGMLRNRPLSNDSRNQGQARRRANRVSSPTVTGTTKQNQQQQPQQQSSSSSSSSSQPQQQSQQPTPQQPQKQTPQLSQKQTPQIVGGTAAATATPVTVQKVVTAGFTKLSVTSSPQIIAPRPSITTVAQMTANKITKIVPSPVKPIGRPITSIAAAITTGTATSTINTMNTTIVNTANTLRIASAAQLNNRQPVKQTSTFTTNKAGDHKIIDLTDEEDRAKTNNAGIRTLNPVVSTVTASMISTSAVTTAVPITAGTSIQAGSIRVVQPHQLTGSTTATLLAPSTSTPPGSRFAYFVPTSGGSVQQRQVLIASPGSQVRPGVMNVQNRQTPLPTLVFKNGTVVPIQQASGTQSVNTAILRPGMQQVLPTRPGQQIRVAPSLVTAVGRMTTPTLTNVPVLSNKHPAPLPNPPVYQPSNANWKLSPPKPELKISKGANKHQQGIVLSWNMTLTSDYEEIASYQLYAYQEGTAQPSTTLWKKVGDVKALPLPMACTLTQFMEGHKYHFAVRAVDVHMRVGPFSTPGNIVLTRK